MRTIPVANPGNKVSLDEAPTVPDLGTGKRTGAGVGARRVRMDAKQLGGGTQIEEALAVVLAGQVRLIAHDNKRVQQSHPSKDMASSTIRATAFAQQAARRNQ